MNLNRRVIVNNTGMELVGENIRKAIYKMMDKKKADECVINVVTDIGVEVDLLSRGKVIDWGVPVFVKEEDK